MRPLPDTRIAIKKLDRHIQICSLLELESPVLSLYSDGRQNWLYLWCDTDGERRTRWLLFVASRDALIEYLGRKKSLRQVLFGSPQTFILEETQGIADSGEQTTYRHLRKIFDLNQFGDYLPTEKSFFDPELAPEIELAMELVPLKFNVPIDSEQWYAVDFNNFFKSYQRIYSFLYATRPRFVRSIKARMEELLRAPWTGGFSRVNLFTTLPSVVPALHALRVPKVQFASPGDVQFEALASVGTAVKSSILRYLAEEAKIEEALRAIKNTLTSMKLNKKDLSALGDADLELPEDKINYLGQKCWEIGGRLGLSDEFASLSMCSPNVIVYSKAVAGLITQIQHLAEFQQEGMLDLNRMK